MIVCSVLLLIALAVVPSLLSPLAPRQAATPHVSGLHVSNESHVSGLHVSNESHVSGLHVSNESHVSGLHVSNEPHVSGLHVSNEPHVSGLHVSNESLALLRSLNLTTLLRASRDARVGGQLLAYLHERRRNRTAGLANDFKNRTAVNAGLQNDFKNRTAVSESATDRTELLAFSAGDDEAEYGEEYDEEYPDFDFSPAAILIYVLELFGTLIGLAWGAFGTFFGAG